MSGRPNHQRAPVVNREPANILGRIGSTEINSHIARAYPLFDRSVLVNTSTDRYLLILLRRSRNRATHPSVRTDEANPDGSSHAEYLAVRPPSDLARWNPLAGCDDMRRGSCAGVPDSRQSSGTA